MAESHLSRLGVHLCSKPTGPSRQCVHRTVEIKRKEPPHSTSSISSALATQVVFVVRPSGRLTFTQQLRSGRPERRTKNVFHLVKGWADGLGVGHAMRSERLTRSAGAVKLLVGLGDGYSPRVCSGAVRNPSARFAARRKSFLARLSGRPNRWRWGNIGRPEERTTNRTQPLQADGLRGGGAADVYFESAQVL